MDIKTAHQHSSNHRETILGSTVVGCFYCLKIYRPNEISEWTDEETTAICPHCGIDSVLGSLSGVPIETGFLKRMCEYWFSAASET